LGAREEGSYAVVEGVPLVPSSIAFDSR
jgi:hypothetical protein